jgi:hypothetical protein
MSLPWDVLHPEQPEPPAAAPPQQQPAPPPATPPPDNLPDIQAPPIDFGRILTDAFAQALRQAATTTVGYAKDTAGHVIAGDDVDFGHPTITATTSQGKELVVADAKNRSWRTLIQGLAIDLMYGLIAALATLTNNDPLQKTTWITFGALVLKTLIQSVVSYFARLRITPTIREKGDKVALVPFTAPIPTKQETPSWR